MKGGERKVLRLPRRTASWPQPDWDAIGGVPEKPVGEPCPDREAGESVGDYLRRLNDLQRLRLDQTMYFMGLHDRYSFVRTYVPRKRRA